MADVTKKLSRLAYFVSWDFHFTFSRYVKPLDFEGINQNFAVAWLALNGGLRKKFIRL